MSSAGAATCAREGGSIKGEVGCEADESGKGSCRGSFGRDRRSEAFSFGGVLGEFESDMLSLNVRRQQRTTWYRVGDKVHGYRTRASAAAVGGAATEQIDRRCRQKEVKRERRTARGT